MVDCKVGDTDDHNFGRQGDGFFPVGELEMVGEDAFLLEGAVGDDGILIGRGDAPIEGGFIGWVVHAWEPVMGAVGPVIAEEAAMTVFVVGDDEAVCGNAFVPDRIGMLGVRENRCLQDEVTAILRVANRLVVFGNGKNGHAFTGTIPCGEVEVEPGCVGSEKNGYDRCAADAVAIVI